jgi:putative nucleotidyltransferase with HDIG domain
MRLSRALFGWMFAASVVPLAAFVALLVLELSSHPSAPPLAPMLRALLGAAALALGVAAAFSARVANRFAQPVRQCVKGALEIARGRFGHEVSVSARNEVGELAYTFNHMSRELASYDAENRRLVREIEAGSIATIRSLASTIDAKDPYTRGHSERVSELAGEVARELGLEGRDVDAVTWGGLLHDIGKIGVPEAVLGKRESLTPAERDVMRAHPLIGAEILREATFLREASHAVRSHHERWDGGGYPEGLAGEEIPLVARIVGVADTFDACTSHRPYQPAMTTERALAVMAALRGAQSDPRVFDALVRVVRRREAAAPAEGVAPEGAAA